MNSKITNEKENRLTITVDKLSKRFNREWIFRDFTYQFLPGNTYAIIGPNGSGKSTFLQVAWGQVPQSSGVINIQNDTAEIPLEELFKFISIATPYMDLIEEFTLAEMMDFHFKLKRIRRGYTQEDVLESIYLKDAYHKPLSNFSSGMKQRVKLGLAIHTDADIFFFDEPGTNLDARAFSWYKDQLSSLPDKAMVFIASNDINEYPASATMIDIMNYKK